MKIASLLPFLWVYASTPAASQPAGPRFQQKEFVISSWYDPPLDDRADESYRMMAEAHFNVVLASSRGHTPEQTAMQLRLCDKYGMKAITWLVKLPADRALDGPACIGYHLQDEPKAPDFPRLAATVKELRSTRPGKLGYINLYPSHGTPKHWGVPTYDEYVTRYLDEVQPDVLCFDRYPLMNPDIDERDGYCENLAIIRQHALARGIPFWNFFKSMPYGRHFDPTEAQIRWQVFTSLAYGARGVLYFCYWTPRGEEFPKGGALITPDGRPTRHYGEACRLNARVKNLGPTLMRMTTSAVYRVRPGEKAAEQLKDAPVRALDDGDWLIGVFRHEDGRTGVLLNNYRYAFTAWPTVTFAADSAGIVEVDQQTGREVPLLDDSPDMPGVQLSLDAGGGRLFLIP